MTRQQLCFYLVDVFAQEPLCGNPLALVVNAQDLEQQTMRRIARVKPVGKHLSASPNQTAGRLASALLHSDGGGGLRVWWWLAEAGQLTLSRPRTAFQQEIGERILPVEVLAEKGKEGEPWRPTAIGIMQNAPTFGAIHNDPAALAAALALEAADLAGESLCASRLHGNCASACASAQPRGDQTRSTRRTESLQTTSLRQLVLASLTLLVVLDLEGVDCQM